MVTTNWPPFYSEKMQNGGPLTHISTEAFKRVGYKVKVSFVPWKRAVNQVQTGHSDALIGAYKNEERLKFAYYSESILGEAKSALVARQGNNITFQSMEKLKPYVIGILRGTSVSKKFDSAKSYLGITEHNSESKLIEMLESGRLDLIAGSEQVFFSEYKTLYPERTPSDYLKSIAILNTEAMYNIFSKKIKNGESLRDAFDRGFKMIVEDGTYGKIMMQHGIE